jgi:hypothetical protein
MFSVLNNTSAVTCCGMKRILLLALVSCFAISLYSQPSDFVIIKSKSNRTLKTYYEGEFISAVNYNGFSINGFIKYIRNDSIVIQQQETRLVPTDFGSKLDTLKYTMGFDYHDVKIFNYSSKYVWGHKKGFAQVTIPKILMIGGIGYIVLESVNTVYRGESFSAHDKWQSLAVAGGLALTGFIWQTTQNGANKVGGKYRVVYMKMTPEGKLIKE